MKSKYKRLSIGDLAEIRHFKLDIKKKYYERRWTFTERKRQYDKIKIWYKKNNKRRSKLSN